jgi:hypothetical protein
VAAARAKESAANVAAANATMAAAVRAAEAGAEAAAEAEAGAEAGAEAEAEADAEAAAKDEALAASGGDARRGMGYRVHPLARKHERRGMLQPSRLVDGTECFFGEMMHAGVKALDTIKRNALIAVWT